MSWQQRSHIIHYGEYPNVPLIGTKYCVNYNPILAQRQFGYLIRGAQNPESLVVVWNLMSSNFCPHLIFKFGDLIEFSVLKD